ncbi:MAG: hypothetical protein LW630_11850, partial [Saprospiraceae bacterium]|nr:hypothetical protein [Saprospiraceae bacterium]
MSGAPHLCAVNTQKMKHLLPKVEIIIKKGIDCLKNGVEAQACPLTHYPCGAGHSSRLSETQIRGIHIFI